MDNDSYKQIKKVREWLEEYDERDVERVISYYEESKGANENLRRYFRKKRQHEQKAAEDSMLLCMQMILHKKLLDE